MQPRERFARLSELRVSFREWAGPTPDAPLLVLLHGAFGDSQMWDRFCPVLASLYRILAPDARGHGASDWSAAGWYSIEAQVGDLVELLDALGHEDDIALIGASMGGVTGYNFAARFPDRVRRLVVVDVAPGCFGQSTGAQQPTRGALTQDRFRSVDDAVRARASVYRRPEDPFVREFIERNLTCVRHGELSWRYDIQGIVEGFATGQDPAAQWSQLKQITAPTLILRGRESTLFTSEMAERMRDAIPTSTLREIPDAGHPIPMDQPASFMATVLSFLMEG